jgi:hypothetical protein
MTLSATCVAEDRPPVGAIRWDAWTGGGVTEQVERTLGPHKYASRQTSVGFRIGNYFCSLLQTARRNRVRR